MTPSTALTAVIAQLSASGLKQVRSPLGQDNASSQRVSRSFAIKPTTLRPSGGRGRADVPGLRVDHSFSVALSHQVVPSLGQEAPSQALSDLHNAWKYLSAFNTTLTQTGAITLGPATTAYVGGGAFIVQTFELVVSYNLDLVI